ncbi:hypothetical protein MTR67_019992 [Solanum verrucosum]|uniref:Uncharacterized protein n=1 Tax=Solanum verrucosum TaxID=315347 RepID=A0AAF0QMH3_SOLVR|nr:hypothetical protein MTR67_019992 [Solanum verrucosum]
MLDPRKKYKEEVFRFVRFAFNVDRMGKVMNIHFLHCKTTINLWHVFFCILGIKLAMPSATLMMLSSWKSFGQMGGDENSLRIIPACI